MPSDPAATLPLHEVPPSSADAVRGSLLGRYVLLDRLGTGGTGEVYAAFDPELDRRVAVKRLHGGTAAALVREARILASLNHPNVVTVHDVGTDDGQAYLAMELIDGEDLARWLAGRATPAWTEVLEIVLACVDGLAAAHGEGIIHGDVKPANILVGIDGRVRVSDFGVARRRGSDADGEGSTAGTPRYMAPEQHRGRVPDARSDVYSLAVTAWEALFGAAPFGGEDDATERPSTGSPAWLADLEDAKQSGPPRVPPDSRGVPAAIVEALHKAMSPEPADRFATMTELGDALRPGASGGRAPVIVVSVAVAAVVGAVGLSAFGEAPDERCSGSADALVDVWDGSRRKAVLARAIELRDAWPDDSATRVAQQLDAYGEAWIAMHRDNCVATVVRGEQPQSEMGVRSGCLTRARAELAATVDLLIAADAEIANHAPMMVGYLPAVERCRDTVAIEHRSLTPNNAALAEQVERIRTGLARAIATSRAGRHLDAREQLEDLEARAEALGYEPLLVELAPTLGLTFERTGDPKQAEAAWRRGAELGIKVGPPDPASRSAAQLTGFLVDHDKRFDEAEVWAAVAVNLARRVGPGTPAEGYALNRRGSLWLEQARYEDAEADYRAALEIFRRTRPPGHPDIGLGLNSLGRVYHDRHQLDDAERYYREGNEVIAAAFGPRHPQVAIGLDNLAQVDEARGDYEASLAKTRQAMEMAEPVLGPNHPQVAGLYTNLGGVLGSLGRFDDQLAAYRRALEIKETVYSPDHVEIGRALNNIGFAALRRQDYAAAEEPLERGLKITEAALGQSHPDVLRLVTNLAIARAQQGDLDGALTQFERALKMREASLPPEHPAIASVLGNLATTELMLGRWSDAEAHFQRSLSIRDADSGEPKDRAFDLFGLGMARYHGGAEAEGLQLARDALAVYRTAGAGYASYVEEVQQWLDNPTPPSPPGT